MLRPRICVCLLVQAALCLALLPSVAAAHHSRAEFVGDVQEVQGTIVEAIWANPHPHVVISVAGDDGSAVEHRIEVYGNLFETERVGLRKDMLVAGKSLRVAGVRSTRRPNYLLGYNLLLDDGTEVLLTRLARPRWTDQVLARDGGDAEYQAQRDSAAREDRGIFRVWSPDLRNLEAAVRARRQIQDLPYTAAAVAAREQWDELNNFLTRCEQPGMPHTMSTPHESEFVDDGRTIRIRNQFFDTVRTVHIGDATAPERQPATHLGYSVGKWEGKTLVIDTQRINWPYLDARGTPQSDAVRIVERYTVSDDQSRLHLQMTITDPATFTRPAIIEADWVALGRTVQKYDCQVF